MVDADLVEFNEFKTSDIAVAIEEIEGEMQAAVDWVNDAFGEIESEVTKLAPVRMLTAFFSFLERR